MARNQSKGALSTTDKGAMSISRGGGDPIGSAPVRNDPVLGVGNEPWSAPDFVRDDVQRQLDAYTLIQDCLDGEVAIKNKGEIYLPKPATTGDTTADDARYAAYKTRAVFYNAAQRTLNGLVGEVFASEPVVEVPDPIKFILEDIDGTGIPVEQLAKEAVSEVLSKGRGGLLTDFPQVDGPITVEQRNKGFIKPTISFWRAEEIINWRRELVGGKWVLKYLVLRGTRAMEVGRFMTRDFTCHRALWLDPDTGQCMQELFINGVTRGTYPMIGGDGKPLTEVPFVFIGQTNNSDRVEFSHFYSLCSLNVGHYRNSADYEESVFLVGQPCVVMSGLTQQWVNDVLKGQVIFGSRAAIPLPVGGAASILQAQPNSLAFEAMQHKERQMVALGAKLVEQQSVQRTATEARQENSADKSVLGTVACNVGEAIEVALRWACVFMNVPVSTETTEGQEAIKFELNTDFDLSKLTFQDRAETIAEWQKGAVTFGEMRAYLTKAGIAYLPEAEAKDAIASEMLQLGLAGGPTAPGNPDPSADGPGVDPATGEPKEPAGVA